MIQGTSETHGSDDTLLHAGRRPISDLQLVKFVATILTLMTRQNG